MNAIPVHDPTTWHQALAGLPRPHLLQSWAWGDLKAKYGWSAERLVWRSQDGSLAAAAQLLHRSQRLPGIPLKLTLGYCPRGPLLDWEDHELAEQVLAALAAAARRRGAFFIKIDPEVGVEAEPTSADHPTTLRLLAAGWRPSPEQVQFRSSFVLDLRATEDELLAGMKPKTRYNIRLAQRKGVRVRTGSLRDVDLLYRMYAETALRDGFAIRKPEYYRDAWGGFIEADLAQPLLAEVEGEPVAGLIAYRCEKTAWYLYGMSRDLHREKMPNHLLQWEAIRWAKAQACTAYDFWGAPDRLDASDPMWGVYRFKSGFGARLVRTIGAWDLPLQPLAYRVYHGLMPRLMALLRRRGRRQTQRSLES